MNIKASGRSALMVAAGIWLWCVGPLQAQEATQAAPPAQQAVQPNPLQQLFGAKPTPAAAPAAEQQPAADAGQPVVLNRYRKVSSRHSRRHRVSRSHRHSRRAVAEDKAASESKAEAKAKSKTESNDRVADADNATVPDKANDAPANDAATPLSSSVANAKAQLLDNHPTTGNATPLSPAPASIADRSSPAMLNDGSPAPQPADAAATEAPRTEAKNDSANEAGVVSSDEVNDVDRAMTAQAEPAPTLALASVNTPGSVTTGQAAPASDDNSSWAQASLIGKIFIAFGGLLTLASAVRMLIA